MPYVNIVIPEFLIKRDDPAGELSYRDKLSIMSVVGSSVQKEGGKATGWDESDFIPTIQPVFSFAPVVQVHLHMWATEDRPPELIKKLEQALIEAVGGAIAIYCEPGKSFEVGIVYQPMNPDLCPFREFTN